MTTFRSLAARWLPRLALAAGVIGLGAAAMPAPAQAWWRGGWGWHGGVVFGVVPPVFLPPPVVYAPPPPVYYAPPAYYAAPAPAYSPAATGQSCYAGAYVCPLLHAQPVGANCGCPAYGGRVDGQVH